MTYVKVVPPNLQKQASKVKGQRNSVISPSWAHTVSVTDLTEATEVKTKIKLTFIDNIFKVFFSKFHSKTQTSLRLHSSDRSET